MKFLTQLCVTLPLGMFVLSPAFAQQAANPVIQDAAVATQPNLSGTNSTSPKPASEQTRLVLPLDHGPHATTTPWANERRRLQAQQKNKETDGSMSSAKPTVEAVR